MVFNVEAHHLRTAVHLYRPWAVCDVFNGVLAPDRALYIFCDALVVDALQFRHARVGRRIPTACADRFLHADLPPYDTRNRKPIIFRKSPHQQAIVYQ